MQNKPENIVNRFLLDRTNLIEIALTAIIIGIGINLTSSATYNKLFNPNSNKDTIFIITGLILIGFSLTYFLLKFYGNKINNRSYEGILFVSLKDKEIIECNGYRLSEELSSFIKGASAEDGIIKKHFEDFFLKKNKQKGFELITEAIEYFLIERLSTHLTDFYNNKKFNKNHIKEFKRNDIPDILLSNRFLELFSKPMNQRTAFYKEDNESNDAGHIVMSYGKDGEIFSRFDLVLPKNSKVTRVDKNSISIDTGRIVLTFKVQCLGFGAVPPRGFMEFYTGHTNHTEYDCYEIKINIQTEFKFGALITRKGWEYYEWIDSFLDKTEKHISSKKFFNDINWKSNYTLIQIVFRTIKELKKS